MTSSKLKEAKKLIERFDSLKDVWLCSMNIGEVKTLLAAQDLISRAEEREMMAKEFNPCIFNSCNDCQILSKRYLERDDHNVTLS